MALGFVIPSAEDRGTGKAGKNRGLAIRMRGHQPFFWLPSPITSVPVNGQKCHT